MERKARCGNWNDRISALARSTGLGTFLIDPEPQTILWLDLPRAHPRCIWAEIELPSGGTRSVAFSFGPTGLEQAASPSTPCRATIRVIVSSSSGGVIEIAFLG